MVNLPKKKVGIVSCSGEELPEGTISRVATRMVLESLRPGDTVTLCLPLFLSGEESERAFARVYPTIAVDGCAKLCAKRATEKYSAPVAASVVVSELMDRNGWSITPERRNLGKEAMGQAEAVAAEIARTVDTILKKRPAEAGDIRPDSGHKAGAPATGGGAVCSCQGGGLPVTQVQMDGDTVGLVALVAIFDQALAAGLAADDAAGPELLQSVGLYNYIPAGAEAQYAEALAREYARFSREKRNRS